MRGRLCAVIILVMGAPACRSKSASTAASSPGITSASVPAKTGATAPSVAGAASVPSAEEALPLPAEDEPDKAAASEIHKGNYKKILSDLENGK